MGQWFRICSVAEAPAEGTVREAECGGRVLCLARVGGELAVLDNVCPHREGPLGQGWVEGGSIVCPWHSWAFDVKTGEAEFPVGERVRVFPVRIAGDDVLAEVEG